MPETQNTEKQAEIGTTISPDVVTEKVETPSLYGKCLTCTDYGTTCRGPNLVAFPDIASVREYHKAIRDGRKIQMRAIFAAASSISEGTIKDYFSHATQDFKWTTVAMIDKALTAICGNRVGKPLQDRPCPASSSEIRQMMANYESRIRELEEESQTLQTGAVERDREFIEKMADQRAMFAQHIDLLNSDLKESKDTCKNYLARIDEKNAQIVTLVTNREKAKRRNDRTIAILTAVLVLALIALTCYVIWDIMHPKVGFFIY